MLFRSRREGVALEKLAKLHAPMGFDIGAVTPEEIAVSVVAEMIQRRRNPGADWNPISKSIFMEGIPKAVQLEPLAGETPGETGGGAAQAVSPEQASSSSTEGSPRESSWLPVNRAAWGATRPCFATAIQPS